jgi:glyoxylase I family protein
MRQEHIAFNVAEPVALADWYIKHLGLKKVGGSGEAFFLADDCGHGVLEIYKNSDAPVPDYFEIHPMALHIAFVSEDVDADEARLIAAGATKFGDTIREDGNTIAMLRGPWGIAIQLAKRDKPFI